MDRIKTEDIEQLTKVITEALDARLQRLILSNPRGSEPVRQKVTVRPVMLKGRLHFQETAYQGNQVFHQNLTAAAMVPRIVNYLEGEFRQCEIDAEAGRIVILVSKKGRINVSQQISNRALRVQETGPAGAPEWVHMLSHNRTKDYILPEGRPVPFLADLGVQTPEGQIIKSKYDKFRQINRYLEFIRDILPRLPKDRAIRIVDFGCGKSYLTFALYYYLHEIEKSAVSIVGLDLKKDVISHCNDLAVKYGYEGLKFIQGDIAGYREEADWGRHADMVVSLHACDTATDDALVKAAEWGAEVILAVPCCQHEVNRQLKCELLAPVLKYGLLKERMAALFTDAIRANLLETQGYEVQLLEFIDMEHTPKNILLRAVKKSKPVTTGRQLEDMEAINRLSDFLNIETTLQKRLK